MSLQFLSVALCTFFLCQSIDAYKTSHKCAYFTSFIFILKNITLYSFILYSKNIFFKSHAYWNNFVPYCYYESSVAVSSVRKFHVNFSESRCKLQPRCDVSYEGLQDIRAT